MHKKNLLLIGPSLLPITGNSYAFSQIVQKHSTESYVLYNGTAKQQKGLKKIFDGIVFFFKVLSILIKNTQIDIVYFNGSMSVFGHIKDILLIYILKFFKKKIVAHYHSGYLLTLIEIELPKPLRNLSIRALKQVDVFIGLLSEMREIYKPFLTNNNKYEYVLNFYNPHFDKYNYRLNNHPPNIISYFSNLMASKGILELLEAFDNIYSKNPEINIQLQIAGHVISDYLFSKEEMQQKIDFFLKKNPKIKYVGAITDEHEKIKFLSNSSLFILPTYYKLEGFPISIIEAMRTGNFIITTDFGYLPFVVKERNGLCIEPKSVNAIEKAILHFLNLHFEERKKVQEYNIDYASKHYSLSNHLSKIDSIFTELQLK